MSAVPPFYALSTICKKINVQFTVFYYDLTSIASITPILIKLNKKSWSQTLEQAVKLSFGDCFRPQR